MPRVRSSRRAFTLLELIVVLVVLGLLAALAIPTFERVTERSEGAAARATLESVGREAVALARYANGDFGDVDFAELAADLPSAAPVGVTAAPRSLVAGVADPGEIGYELAGDERTLALATPVDGDTAAYATVTVNGQATSWTVDGSADPAAALDGPPADPGDVPADPPGPVGPVTAVTAPGTLTLSWDPVDGADAYSVLLDGTEVATTTDTTYTVDGLTSGDTYTASVVAVNAAGSSEPSVVEATPGVTALTFASNGDTNGLFHHLGTAGGTQAWANPAASSTGYVDDWSTHRQDGFVSANLTDRSASIWANGGAGASSITWDLGHDRALDVDRYSLLMTGDAGSRLSGWNVQGSTNGTAWTTLHSVSSHAGTINAWYDFSVTGTTPWRFLRLNTVTPNHVSLAEIEFYGTLTTQASTRSHDYTRLGGTGGLVWDLGGGDLGTFTNPATLGPLEVRAIAVLNSAWTTYATDRNPSTIWHGNCGGSRWISFDLGPHRAMRVDRYELAINDQGIPRSWVLQGSSDGTNWVPIDSRTDDLSFTEYPSRAGHWTTGTQQAHRYLRLVFTKDSLNWGCASVAEIEFYGQLTETTLAGVAPLDASPVGANGLLAARRAAGQPVATTASHVGGGTTGAGATSGNVDGDWWFNNCGGYSTLTVDAGAGRTFTPHGVALRPHATDQSYPLNWAIEGSNDNANWVPLSSHTKDENMRRRGSMWDVAWLDTPGTTPYRYLRLRMTGDSGYANCFVLMEIEFYGDMS